MSRAYLYCWVQGVTQTKYKFTMKWKHFYEAQKQHCHKISMKNKMKEQDTKEQKSSGANRASRRQQSSTHSRPPISPPSCGSESGAAAVHNKILLYGFGGGCLRPYQGLASTCTGRDFLAISHRCGFGCDLSVCIILVKCMWWWWRFQQSLRA